MVGMGGVCISLEVHTFLMFQLKGCLEDRGIYSLIFVCLVVLVFSK